MNLNIFLSEKKVSWLDGNYVSEVLRELLGRLNKCSVY